MHTRQVTQWEVSAALEDAIEIKQSIQQRSVLLNKEALSQGTIRTLSKPKLICSGARYLLGSALLLLVLAERWLGCQLAVGYSKHTLPQHL